MRDDPGARKENFRELVHEIRNHLGAILSAARALHKVQNDPDLAGEMLRVIESNVRQATEAVGKIPQPGNERG